ncbi:MAG: hypothetical protein ABJF79_03135, partial [Paracoccaceae bacterium]
PDTEPSRLSDDTTLIVKGDLGPASALINRFRDAGLDIVERDGPGQLRFGDAVLNPVTNIHASGIIVTNA